MRRLLLTLASLLLLPVAAWSQTATVSGHLLNPDGSAPTNAKVCFSLQQFAPNVPRISGTTAIIQMRNFCVAASTVDGSFSTVLYRNDFVSPAGTFWRVDYFYNGIQQSSASYLVNAATFNLDSATPLSTTPLAGPNQLITQSYLCSQPTAATTWSCVHNFNDKNVVFEVYDLTGKRIFPDLSTVTDSNTVTFSWVTAQAGSAVIVHAGSIAIATNQPNAILSNPTGAQTIQAGQSLTVAATAAFANINNVIFADQQAGATADVKLNNCAAALPAGGGTCDARGFGATTQTIAATVTLSYASKPITWLFDRATLFQCTITNGTACWNAPASTAGFSFVFFGDAQPNVVQKGFSVSNAANISSVFNIATITFSMIGVQIVGNSLATLSGPAVNIVNALQTSDLRGLASGGFSNTQLLRITQTSGQAVGPLNIYNPSLDCQGVTGCKPLLIQAVASGGVMAGINFYGGSFTHPGAGGLNIVDLEGITGNDVAGVNFFGPQLESSNLADIGFLVNNATGIAIHSPVFTASTNAGTTAVRITGANTDGVIVTGLDNFGLWTNNIVNVVNSDTIASASQNRTELYVYNTGTRLGAVFDTAVTHNGTLGLTNAGVFTNTQMNLYMKVLLNGCDPLTEYQATQGANYSTDAQTGCVAVPGGATVHQANGLAGYANTSSTTAAAVGTYGQGRCLLSNTLCWGGNDVVQDAAAQTGHQMIGREIDINVKGTPNFLEGVRLIGASTGTIPASAIAFHLLPPGTGKLWPNGFLSEDAAVSGAAFVAGSVTASANSNSQSVIFHTRDAGNVVRSLTLSAQGLTADRSVALGDVAGTLVTDTGAQTLSNKTVNGGAGNLLISLTAPTISAHFNTSGDSVSASNGTAAFTVTVGTGAAGSTGAVGLPTATTGWICFAANRNRAAYIQQTGSTATTATFTNYGTTVGTPVNWTNSDVLAISCHAY